MKVIYGVILYLSLSEFDSILLKYVVTKNIIYMTNYY